MENQNVKLNETNAKGSDPLFNSVVKTSIKTLTYLFLIILISITYLTMRFPYNAMTLYMDFSMYETAFIHCGRAINASEKSGNNSMLVECLVNGIEMSDMLYDRTLDTKYAAHLMDFSQKYALNPEFDQTNAILDEFYLNGLEIGKGGEYLSLFSYKNYVYSLNQMARFVLNDNDKMLFEGSLVEVASLKLDDLSALDAVDLAVLFNQASYMQNEQIAAHILSVAPQFLLQANQILSSDRIKGLFLIKSALNISDALTQFYSNVQDVESAFMFNGMSISEYFNSELKIK